MKVANDTFSSIIGQGIASITPLTLQNVLQVPNLSCNLLSVNKITKDLNCFVKFCDIPHRIEGKDPGAI